MDTRNFIIEVLERQIQMSRAVTTIDTLHMTCRRKEISYIHAFYETYFLIQRPPRMVF